MTLLPATRRDPDPDQGDASVEFRADDQADGNTLPALARLLVQRYRRRAVAERTDDAADGEADHA